MREVGNIPMGNSSSYPPPGKHLCRCIKAKPWTSPNKKTPAAMLTFVTRDAIYQFEDPVFITSKAIGRLALVAIRLCQMSRDTKLPDDDLEAAKQLGHFIVNNAEGKDALVIVEEQEEEYIVQDGPDMGQTRKTNRRRVAFGGYQIPSQDNQLEEAKQHEEPKQYEDGIPF